MTKAELVEKMAADAGITKVAAAAALDSFTGNVAKALKKNRRKYCQKHDRAYKKAHNEMILTDQDSYLVSLHFG